MSEPIRESSEAATQREQFWEQYSLSYDRVLLELSFYQALVAAHVDAMCRPEIRQVLEIGAGTGNVTVAVARTGCTVTAVDNSEAMIGSLRRKLTAELADRIRVVKCDAERLTGIADESFDGVTISHALYDMVNPEAAWSEALRVLKPGGILAITEPNRTFNVEFMLQAGERELREKGLYDSLQADWQRVFQAGHDLKIQQRGSRLPPDEIFRRLRDDLHYSEVAQQPAYLGNCTTVVGRKPTVRKTDAA